MNYDMSEAIQVLTQQYQAIKDFAGAMPFAIEGLDLEKFDDAIQSLLYIATINEINEYNDDEYFDNLYRNGILDDTGVE